MAFGIESKRKGGADKKGASKAGHGKPPNRTGIPYYVRARDNAKQPLPHADTIQQSFGEHDIGSTRAAVGGEAGDAARSLGAKAFTTGDAVAFDRPPDLRTAAHEAAHVVQQRNDPTAPAIQRAPQDNANPGDSHFPGALTVDWGELFEISFGERTTGYGDRKLQLKFRYMGYQKAERAEDAVKIWELDPIIDNLQLGVLENRPFDVQIIDDNNQSLQLDIYNDGKVIYDIAHVGQLSARSPGATDHRIEIYRNSESYGWFTLSFTNPNGVLVGEGGRGLLEVNEKTAPPPAPEEPTDLDEGSDLPTGMLIELILVRLDSLAFMPLNWTSYGLRTRLDEDMKSETKIGDDQLHVRLRKLLDLTAYLGPIFTTLDSLMKPGQYAGGLETDVHIEILRIGELYVDAMADTYLGEDTGVLAKADKALADFPAWLNYLYLRDERGVKSFTDQLPGLQKELDEWDAKTNYSSNIRAKWLTNTSQQRANQRNDIEWAWRGEKDVHDTIHQLFTDVQVDIGLLTAMIAAAQVTQIARLLSDSIINDALEGTFWADREDKAWGYVSQLDQIIFDFENAGKGEGANRNNDNTAALKKLIALIGSDEFTNNLDLFQNRLKWVDRISFVAKLALIIAAAALTAGAAGELAFAAVETGLAGSASAGVVAVAATGAELVTSGLVFTAVSRKGQTIAFGAAEGNFYSDWFWNTVTLGVLKGSQFAFGKFFKNTLKLNPKVAKIRYGLGQAASSMVSLHLFGEIHTLITKHRLMTWDERGEALFQNVALMVMLEAGKFITTPLQLRLTSALSKGAGLQDFITNKAAKLEGRRTALREKLEGLSRGEAAPDEIAGLAIEIEKLWGAELSLLESNAKLIGKEAFQNALASYQQHIANMQLRLAKLNLDMPIEGGSVFEPIRPGIVSYTPEGLPVLEKAYAVDPKDASTEGRSLTKSKVPGVFEGRLPNGEVTFFIPKGSAAKVPNTDQIIAGRDAAVLAAKTDPLAAEGLKRLNEGLQGKGPAKIGQKNIDAILGSMTPENALEFLRMLADPAFATSSTQGVSFYQRLAANPDAILFARAYGGDVYVSMVQRYGNRAPEMLERARAELESAKTDADRDTILDTLKNGTDTAVDALLDNAKVRAPRPRAGKWGVAKRSTSFQRSRNDAEAFAKGHNAKVSDAMLDKFAELLEIHGRAMSNQYEKLTQAQKEELLSHFDALADEIGAANETPGGRDAWEKTMGNWRNTMRGAIGESLGRPKGVAKFKGAFLNQTRVAKGTSGSTEPDYEQPAPSGGTEWVDIKTDLIDGSAGEPGPRTGVYNEGIDAAKQYRKDAAGDAPNLPAGDSLSIQFLRDPLRGPDPIAGKATRAKMLDILFGDNSPIRRVKFGDGPWISRDAHLGGKGSK